MSTERLQINDNLALEAYFYESFEPNLFVEYVEKSPDPWYSDNTTTVDLDQDMARKVIAFLENYLKATRQG